jgi:hypothetical protein
LKTNRFRPAWHGLLRTRNFQARSVS